jgi:4-amino-4-deoxy-L-arabinose transferase-like glycosyltransferase
MARLTTGLRPYALLTLLCLLVFVPGLDGLPVTDRDEARFAQATKQMLQTGDYVVPYVQDAPRTKKPIGIYWLQAASTALFSSAEAREIWSYRIPSALGGWAAVLLTFAIGRRLFDSSTGLVAAGLLASSVLLIVEAHIATADAVLLASGLISFLGLSRLWTARQAAGGDRATPPYAWLQVWGGLGLAALVKGPVVPTVIGLAILGLRVAAGNWAWIRGWRPGVGLLLALAIFSPWGIALVLSDAAGFVAQSAQEDLIPKLLSGQESHGAPPGTYLAAVYASFWPASLAVVPAFVAAWYRRRDAAVAFCLAWIVPAWIMFELVPTKLPHYPLPTYPAVALLAAAMLTQRWSWPTRAHWRWLLRLHVGVWCAVGLGLAGVVAVVPWRFADEPGWWAWPLAALLLSGTAAVVWTGRQGARPAVAGAMVATMAAAIPWIGSFYAPRLHDLWIARAVAWELPPPSERPPLASTGISEPSLVFRNGTETLLTSPTGAARYLAETPDSFALIAGGKRLAKVQSLLAEREVTVRPLTVLQGFNYSEGEELTLHLLHRPADSASGAARVP